VDSGYLVRTVDTLGLTFGGTGFTAGTAAISGVWQITPFNFSTTTGLIYAAYPSGTGTGNPFANLGFTNFITGGAAVKRYRPVAACAKFVPTGAIGTRSGVVGLSYSPGQIFAPADPLATGTTFLSDCQKIDSNGSSSHEVRWLPTAVDENFTDVAMANNPSAGSLIVVLNGVDGVVAGATSGSVNGYIEITAVWEWVPPRTGGMPAAPKAPLPYTSQQVLSTIGDMGSYIFEGVRTAGAGLIRAGVQEGVRVIGAAMQRQVRGHPVPMITW